MKVRLKELGTIFTGNTPSKKVDEYWSNRDIKFIKPDVIKDELCVISSANEYISASAKNVSRIVPANSILVTCIGKIGRVGITEEEVSFNQQINAIVPNEAIIPKYLAYAIYANRKQLKAIANAPVVPIINKTQFSDFKISICESVEKQNKIVRTLDVISGIITHDKKKIEALDELIKARFVEMFGNNKYETRIIKDVLCESFWLMPATPKYIDEGIPYITSKNIKNRILDLDDTKFISENDYVKISKNRPIKPGDILVSMIGTLGQTAVVSKDKRFYGQNIYLLRLNNDIISTSFFCEFFNSDDVQNKLAGKSNKSTQAYLKANHVEDLSIPIPPIAVQNDFATFVAQVDKSKFVLSNELTMCDFYIRLIHDRVMHSRINLRMAQ